MEKRIIDIHCQNCGAAVSYDVVHGQYLCSYCGSKVTVSEAGKQKEGFKKIHSDKMKNELKKYSFFTSTCLSCGAAVVFNENEALSKCPFCSKSLLRKDYPNAKDFPEYLIPFAITAKEAQSLLKKWCDSHRNRKEAKLLSEKTGQLQGFYLPYDLIRGPVSLKVSRMDRGSDYHCEGFINDEFVNRSGQLDNLLLDGMEPYDLDELREFDYGYIAGNGVKISDINDAVLLNRASEEASKIYAPFVRKVLESRAVHVNALLSDTMKLPVLLPVYYICEGELMAAVNGQTGKVAVRALKQSHYLFLPWWLKAILATLAFSLAFFAVISFFPIGKEGGLYITLLLAAFFLIVTLCYFSDTAGNALSISSGRKIFTSGKTFHRLDRELVSSDTRCERKVEEPVFFETIEGESVPVVLKFTSPLRILRMALLCFVALFLPVIVALFLNGFDFQKLTLGGSAVWFCIMVPVVPIYLLKFGIVELYERPMIYLLKDGKKKRYHKKTRISFKSVLHVLKYLFIPPYCFLIWILVLVFFAMCYFTAFGFD